MKTDILPLYREREGNGKKQENFNGKAKKIEKKKKKKSCLYVKDDI